VLCDVVACLLLVIAYSCIFDAEHSLLLIIHIFKICVASTQCQIVGAVSSCDMTSEAETPSCVLSSIMQKHSSLPIFEIQRWADLVVNGTADVNTPPRQLQDIVFRRSASD